MTILGTSFGSSGLYLYIKSSFVSKLLYVDPPDFALTDSGTGSSLDLAS